jgi:hypothetical protein
MVATTGHRGPAFACVSYFRHFQKLSAPRPQCRRIRTSTLSRPKPGHRASAPKTGDGETARPETFGHLPGNIPVHFHLIWLSCVLRFSMHLSLISFSLHKFLLTYLTFYRRSNSRRLSFLGSHVVRQHYTFMSLLISSRSLISRWTYGVSTVSSPF